MQLQRTEADVVIVLTNPADGRMEVYPYWECEIRVDALPEHAANLAVGFVERCGSGWAEIHIIDHRDTSETGLPTHQGSTE